MLDGFSKYDYLTGGIVAIVATIMVFIILILIIFLTELVAKALKGKEEELEENIVTPVKNVAISRLDLNDENATVAALVASIDYRLKNKTNVRVVSIREVK